MSRCSRLALVCDFCTLSNLVLKASIGIWATSPYNPNLLSRIWVKATNSSFSNSRSSSCARSISSFISWSSWPYTPTALCISRSILAPSCRCRVALIWASVSVFSSRSFCSSALLSSVRCFSSISCAMVASSSCKSACFSSASFWIRLRSDLVGAASIRILALVLSRICSCSIRCFNALCLAAAISALCWRSFCFCSWTTLACSMLARCLSRSVLTCRASFVCLFFLCSVIPLASFAASRFSCSFFAAACCSSKTSFSKSNTFFFFRANLFDSYSSGLSRAALRFTRCSVLCFSILSTFLFTALMFDSISVFSSADAMVFLCWRFCLASRSPLVACVCRCFRLWPLVSSYLSICFRSTSSSRCSSAIRSLALFTVEELCLSPLFCVITVCLARSLSIRSIALLCLASFMEGLSRIWDWIASTAARAVLNSSCFGLIVIGCGTGGGGACIGAVSANLRMSSPTSVGPKSSGSCSSSICILAISAINCFSSCSSW